MSPVLPSLIANVGTVIKGKDETLRLATIALICGGHLLLEDVPGVGKTMLAKAIAKSLHVQFQRIQFTPDLLPSDVVGMTIFNQQTRMFEYRQGPIFSNVVLADEINRATPRTQSSLLEAMNEAQVTSDQTSYPLPQPFFVIATQNPTEFQGTFPLPEAQLDRFLLRVSLGYPDFSQELEILNSQRTEHPIDVIQAIATGSQVLEIQHEVRQVHISPEIQEYIVRVAQSTRSHPKIRLGVSPRGTLALMRASQGSAYLKSRRYVGPDDVQAMIGPTLGHRMVLHRNLTETARIEPILRELIESVPVPV